jgi:hypothetical protein
MSNGILFMKTFILALIVALVSLTGAKADGDDKPKFELCDASNVYRIDDPLLADKGYASLPLVETNPEFPGGSEALQKFFDENLKLGDDAKNVFGRVPITFVVNCNGNLGDFKFIGRVFPEMAQNIINVARKMPDWNAGKAKGKAVDTRAKLSFTSAQGRASRAFR